MPDTPEYNGNEPNVEQQPAQGQPEGSLPTHAGTGAPSPEPPLTWSADEGHPFAQNQMGQGQAPMPDPYHDASFQNPHAGMPNQQNQQGFNTTGNAYGQQYPYATQNGPAQQDPYLNQGQGHTGQFNQPNPYAQNNPYQQNQPNMQGQFPPTSQPGDQNGQQGPQVTITQMPINLTEEESRVFVEARRYVTASQIIALASVLLGMTLVAGIPLSAAAIVVAVVANRRLSSIARNYPNDPIIQSAIKRPGFLALSMAILALVLNTFTLIVMYPALVEALQQNGFSGLFQFGSTGASAPSSPSGSSLWG